MERRERAAQPEKAQPETHLEKPIEENVNRLLVDGVEARTVDEAISVLRYV